MEAIHNLWQTCSVGVQTRRNGELCNEERMVSGEGRCTVGCQLTRVMLESKLSMTGALKGKK